MNNKIISFINNHHVFTLATSKDDQPYCAICFYVFLNEQNMMVFMSDRHTKHMSYALSQRNVAGTIVTQENNISKIQGIQFTGTMAEIEGELMNFARKIYLRKFPVARAQQADLFSIQLDFIKMTNNQLGFGKKLIWERVEA